MIHTWRKYSDFGLTNERHRQNWRFSQRPSSFYRRKSTECTLLEPDCCNRSCIELSTNAQKQSSPGLINININEVYTLMDQVRAMIVFPIPLVPSWNVKTLQASEASTYTEKVNKTIAHYGQSFRF